MCVVLVLFLECGWREAAESLQFLRNCHTSLDCSYIIIINYCCYQQYYYYNSVMPKSLHIAVTVYMFLLCILSCCISWFLISFSLMVNDNEHFMWLLVICTSPLETFFAQICQFFSHYLSVIKLQEVFHGLIRVLQTFGRLSFPTLAFRSFLSIKSFSVDLFHFASIHCLHLSHLIYEVIVLIQVHKGSPLCLLQYLNDFGSHGQVWGPLSYFFLFALQRRASVCLSTSVEKTEISS